ncbi:amino acid transporter [Microthyrium microscopicum]|uniref:Amino acid transporter n=1 Tax=Microthyrium microscopicum TaxID=703497 RepID=A0A6A6U6J7_9PEZI|nr:amino acid transporter [Microthyrium microscopicum]
MMLPLSRQPSPRNTPSPMARPVHSNPEPSSPSPRASIDSYTDSQHLLAHPAASNTLKLTPLNGLALVLGLQIGSGIFSAPSTVSLHVASPAEGLGIWLIGGLLAWTGASSFVELGLAVPRNGGIQEYLQECYGDFMAFLFTWTWVVIVKPCANAVIATVLADYACSAVLPGKQEAAQVVTKAVGVLAVVAISTLNCLGARTGPQAANGFLVLKLGLVLSIVVLGLAFCVGRGDGIPKSKTGWLGSDPLEDRVIWVRFGDLVTALFAALFCYGGWESIGFVVGDMKAPTKNLPRVLHSSMTITICSFFGLVVALYLCLPMDNIRSHTTLAADFGEKVLGQVGRRAYAFAIAISTLGALNTNIFATAKLCESASQRGYLPAVLANLHFEDEEDEMLYYDKILRKWPLFLSYPIIKFAKSTAKLRITGHIPIYAIMLNAFMAIFYVVVGTFNGLVVFVGIAEYFFFFFCVLGVFVIRARRARNSEPHLYQTWTINPLIFITLSSLFVIRGLVANPLQGVALCAVSLVGWIVFWIRFPSRHHHTSIRAEPPA